jgi:uncharacterized protein YkwD
MRLLTIALVACLSALFLVPDASALGRRGRSDCCSQQTRTRVKIRERSRSTSSCQPAPAPTVCPTCPPVTPAPTPPAVKPKKTASVDDLRSATLPTAIGSPAPAQGAGQGSVTDRQAPLRSVASPVQLGAASESVDVGSPRSAAKVPAGGAVQRRGRLVTGSAAAEVAGRPWIFEDGWDGEGWYREAPVERSAALDDVNRQRAARGLPAYVRDDGLEQAALAAASYRAAHGIRGHTGNDFAFLPQGSSAPAAGCAAVDASWGFLSCCRFENWTFAGAASVTGADGLVYHHLFVR